MIPALVVARYNRDGRLDTSFGAGGLVRNDFPGAAALVLQPDGKLVTAGTQFVFTNGVPPDQNLVLQRFNPDGSPDTSFGSAGLVVADFDGDNQALALVLQPDGKLVVAGVLEALGARNRDFALARYHSDGSLDTSFGTGGLVVTDFSQVDRANALVLQVDGKLVVAGTLGAFRTPDFAVARYHSDGSLDTSFGTGGLVRTVFGRTSIGASALVLQADGKLVVAGGTDASGDFDFAIASYVTTDEPLAVPRTCGGRPATILGTSRNDTIRGTRGPDVILGLRGNDTIRGFNGADTICGGAGRDTLIGNDGKDRLLGENGDDELFGDTGRDRIDGGSGRDACRTGEMARRCEGEPASSKPTSGERPKDPPKVPCPPVSNFPCS